MKKKKAPRFQPAIGYALLPGVLVLPLLTVIYLSFIRQWEFPVLLSAQYTGANWALAWKGTSGIAGSFFLTAGIALGVSLASTATGALTSRYVCYQRAGNRLLSLAFFPYLIAPVALGVMLQYYFILLGIYGTVAGVMLAQFVFVFPYAVLFFSGFWTPQTRSLENQASTLGATPAQVAGKVLWPLGKNWAAMCAFQCFVLSWFEYGITQFAGIGKVRTLTVLTMQYVKEANPHVAAVAAALMVLPLLALAALNRNLLFRNPAGNS